MEPRFAPNEHEQTAIIYDASIPHNHVPIVELSAYEQSHKCILNIRCYESQYADWLQGLVCELSKPLLQQQSGLSGKRPEPRFVLDKLLVWLGLIPPNPPESRPADPPTPRFAPGIVDFPRSTFEYELWTPPREPSLPQPAEDLSDAGPPRELLGSSEVASPPPKRRRGPKPGVAPDQMEALCVLWLETEQYVHEMWYFCNEHRISPSQLKAALRNREDRTKGQGST